MQLKNVQLKVKVEVGLKFEITFLTQHLGLSIFYPALLECVYIYKCLFQPGIEESQQNRNNKSTILHKLTLIFNLV